MTKEHEAQVREYVKERDEVLLSLDETKIRAHAKKWGVALPSSWAGFWGGVHKARLAITTFPKAEKEKSRAWLAANGMSPDIRPVR
jgi:hypothetical protein